MIGFVDWRLAELFGEVVRMGLEGGKVAGEREGEGAKRDAFKGGGIRREMIGGVDEDGGFGLQPLGVDPQLVAVVRIGGAVEGFVLGVENIGGLAGMTDDDVGDAFFLVFGVEPDVVLERHVKGGVIVEMGLEIAADIAFKKFVHVEEVGAEAVMTRGAFEGKMAQEKGGKVDRGAIAVVETGEVDLAAGCGRDRGVGDGGKGAVGVT